MGVPNNRDWKAWEDSQPPNPPGSKLHVSGEVETTNSAIVPVLKPAVPQGINPNILILDLTLENAGGPGTDDINYRPAKYEDDIREGLYYQVHINWEGATVDTVDVESVQ